MVVEARDSVAGPTRIYPILGYPGELDLVWGPMFGGKSTVAVVSARQAREEGLAVVAAKPFIDNGRHTGLNGITTHNGLEFPEASLVQSSREFYDLVRQQIEQGTNPEKILAALDEAFMFQYLDPKAGLAETEVVSVIEELKKLRVRSLVLTLDRSYLREPWMIYESLLPLAERSHRRLAWCAIGLSDLSTRHNAQFTQRLYYGQPASRFGNALVIGKAAEKSLVEEPYTYQARCAKCHQIPD